MSGKLAGSRRRRSSLRVFDCCLNSRFCHSAGILQPQGLLTQLPPSQANLLPTQPSITLAQVGHDAKIKPLLSHFTVPLCSLFLTFNRIFYCSVVCSLQHQPARQQPHLFSPCPTVRHHPNGWIPRLWRSLVIWRNWNSLPRPSNRGVSNWASHRCVED